MNDISINYPSSTQSHFLIHLLEGHPDIFSMNDIKVFRKRTKQFFSHPNSSDSPLVLTIHNKDAILGVVIFSKIGESQDYFKIEWFAVKKEEEGKGLGSKLFKETFTRIKSLGGKHIYLETSHEKHNGKAKHFYRKMGFHSVGILPNFYPPPIAHRKHQEDSVIYIKTL